MILVCSCCVVVDGLLFLLLCIKLTFQCLPHCLFATAGDRITISGKPPGRLHYPALHVASF